MRAALVIFFVSIVAALPLFANQDVCSAEYSAEQCDQLGDGDGGGNNGTGGEGSTPCPFYLCGNATGNNQSSWAWCEATQSWSDCPILYCSYRSCVGTNCYPTSMTCTTCSSRQGNNVHVSDCPRS